MITKEDFKKYVAVQMSGVTNMFMVSTVSQLSGLAKEKIFDIMKNYGNYAETFKGVTQL